MLAVLHPGAMGAAAAACLIGRGHEVGWLCTGRSEASLQRAEQAGLTAFDAVGEPEGFGAAASQVFAASVNEDP